MSARLPLALFVLAAALWPRPGAAQEPPLEMSSEVNARRVQVGDVFQLDVMLTLRTAGEPEELVLPDLGAFEVVRQERAPTSQRTVIRNGRQSSSRQFGFTYYLRANAAGEKQIGAGRVRLGRAVATAEPVTIVVEERANKGAPGKSSALDPMDRFSEGEVPRFFLDARFDRDEAFVGQQVLLTVDVYATEYVDLDLRNLEPPKPQGFWVEVLESPSRIRPTQRTLGGKTFLVYEVLRVALFPLQEGTQTLDPVALDVGTTSGTWRRRQNLRISSEPVSLDVLPLPRDGRPPGFSEANVGHFQLRAEVSEHEVPLGQPFTLKLKVGGEGNVGAVTLPDVASALKGARVFPPTTSEVKGVSKGRLHGEKVLEVLVQPTRPGTFEVSPFSLAYFDPEQRRYQRAESEPIRVRVTPKEGGRQGVGSSSRQVLASGGRPVLRNLQAPGRDGRLYRQPLYASTLSLVGLGGGLAFAFGLLRARGRATDTAVNRRRRRAREKALANARQDKDLARAERIVLDALAERYGGEVRGLSASELSSSLAGRLTDEQARALRAFLEDAQAARYAPRGGADKKALFDEAERLLAVLDEERP